VVNAKVVNAGTGMGRDNVADAIALAVCEANPPLSEW
jgi:hypothetical protein